MYFRIMLRATKFGILRVKMLNRQLTLKFENIGSISICQSQTLLFKVIGLSEITKAGVVDRKEKMTVDFFKQCI